MPRHARNCTAGSVYTYHEKVKDAQQSGYGTQAMRLGKDSIKVCLIFYGPVVGRLSSVVWRCVVGLHCKCRISCRVSLNN